MRFCNYVTLAAILVAALLIPLKIQSSEVDTITDVKQSYSHAMETAVDDAMESAVESDHGDDVDLNKDHIIDKFYHTLFINLGCPNDTIKQNAVKAYIPVTVLVARDGFYVNYSTTVTTSNGDKIITKNWSKKIPFTYTEANSGRVFTFSLDDNIKIYDPHSNSVSGGDYHDFAKISSFNEMFENYLSRPNVRQPILTQYCDGQRVTCPDWMSQWGSKYLGDQGYSAIDILRSYYGNDMYINSAEGISGIPASWPGYDLGVGASGPKVRQLQEQLARISRAYPAIPTITADGVYGSRTREAVEKFQSVFGLPVTGIVDYPTWYKISDIYVAVSRIAELV